MITGWDWEAAEHPGIHSDAHKFNAEEQPENGCDKVTGYKKNLAFGLQSGL